MEFVPTPAVHRVLCADCGKLVIILVQLKTQFNLTGTAIEPNSANLCIGCLRNSCVYIQFSLLHTPS